MSHKRIDRRDFLLASTGLYLTASQLHAQTIVHEVKIVLNYDRGLWYYDPVGLYIEPGDTVRWQALRWTPTVTSFHPDIDNHELRIPEGAEPFDSGMLAAMQIWEKTFTVEGTYDYYSKHHEAVGLIGRIVVGQPGGPAENPPRYGGAEGRNPIYRLGMRVFNILDSKEIAEKRTVPFPVDQLARGRYRRLHGTKY
jgi:plastocyanin